MLMAKEIMIRVYPPSTSVPITIHILEEETNMDGDEEAARSLQPTSQEETVPS
jgi:hypothetical protein